MREITVAQFHTELKAQGVSCREDLAFECPTLQIAMLALDKLEAAEAKLAASEASARSRIDDLNTAWHEQAESHAGFARQREEALLTRLAAAEARISALEQAIAPFAAVIKDEEQSHLDGLRPPIEPDEYISIYKHGIVAADFIKLCLTLKGQPYGH